jgi:long-chain acyl-CoA synthetase
VDIHGLRSASPARYVTKIMTRAPYRCAVGLMIKTDEVSEQGCAWLGVIAVPLNTWLSAMEIDQVLADASPRGLIRHSLLPVPTVQLSWQRVLDEEPLDLRSDTYPDAIYDPEATLALVYTSGTTGRPKGVVLTHAATLANVDHVNYWIPYREGGVYLHAAPMI